jgi:hypothetical protein
VVGLLPQPRLRPKNQQPKNRQLKNRQLKNLRLKNLRLKKSQWPKHPLTCPLVVTWSAP